MCMGKKAAEKTEHGTNTHSQNRNRHIMYYVKNPQFSNFENRKQQAVRFANRLLLISALRQLFYFLKSSIAQPKRAYTIFIILLRMEGEKVSKNGLDAFSPISSE